MNICIIDDEKAITDVLYKYLSKNGHQARAFCLPAEFLEHFHKEGNNIDIVIVDIMMPEITGIEILQTVRKEKPEIVVVMITGYATVEQAVECLKLGAFDFLEKPFNMSAIERIINNASRIRQVTVERSEFKLMNERLLEVDRLKDEFIANTTHELKTPLFAISGAAENLREFYSSLDKDGVSAMLDVIDGNSSRLKGLINQILLTAKIEKGAVNIEMDTVPAVKLIESAIKTVSVLAGRKNIKIMRKLPEMETQIYCDREKTEQILINLLGNAVKFSPEGKSITVSLYETSGREVIISVKDEGPGIPEDKKNNIFTKFYQVDGTMTRKAGGTGLGLYLSKKLAESQSARLWFESGTAGGAEFFLALKKTSETVMSVLDTKNNGNL